TLARRESSHLTKRSDICAKSHQLFSHHAKRKRYETINCARSTLRSHSRNAVRTRQLQRETPQNCNGAMLTSAACHAAVAMNVRSAFAPMFRSS
ncbi:hypothetical protein ABTN47_18560, partial [Acinetobacter baumannii]